MPAIILTLTDTPDGAVAIHSTFKPAVGNPCSPAQSTALEIISRTQKQWGIHVQVKPVVHVDQDHCSRRTLCPDPHYCECDLESTVQEVETNRCAACGGNIL